MTYYLLKDINSGEPYEMLAFKGDVKQWQIQASIDEANEYYYGGHEDEIDEKYGSQEQYILHCLVEEYDLDVLPWNNEDNLYF